MDILDAYVNAEPDHQNILDIFRGEWSSRLPAELGLETLPGNAPLFEDTRIRWAEEEIGGFSGMHVLELGPLEGGHSYMLQQMGVKHCISIEANARSFLKCLCVKEVLNLDRVQFRLGDFMPYLENTAQQFDGILASGVLYHMTDPIRLIKLMSAVTNRVFIWTHYYDRDIIRSRAELSGKFEEQSTTELDGNTYECALQAYNQALNWAGFCGGPQPNSIWLSKPAILEALSNYGLTHHRIGFEDLDHQNGPAFAVIATRERYS